MTENGVRTNGGSWRAEYLYLFVYVNHSSSCSLSLLTARSFMTVVIVYVAQNATHIFPTHEVVKSNISNRTCGCWFLDTGNLEPWIGGISGGSGPGRIGLSLENRCIFVQLRFISSAHHEYLRRAMEANHSTWRWSKILRDFDLFNPWGGP